MQKFIYHLLIDRFTGNSAVKGKGFKGGTLKGVLSHLDYIQDLGANGIMLTPFYETDAYHGYHITNYENIDPHFGIWKDVQELVEEAHRRGMIIIADFVANHCHKNNYLFADGKHSDWFLYRKDGYAEGFADIEDLPMFNTDNNEVRRYLIDAALRLCEIGFDAIRLDHATGPSYAFWKQFHTEIKKSYPNVKLIGEVWGSLDFKPRNKLRYFWHWFRYGDQEAKQLEYVGILDGVFDFQYQSILCGAARKKMNVLSDNKFKEHIKKHFARYPKEFDLWLFLDNHDLNRFLYNCRGDRKLLEDAMAFTRQQSYTSLMYYGTEIGMTNETSIFDGTPYADERVRECMIFNK